MDGLLKMGRLFFAIAMAFFGVQYFIYASLMKGPIPGPPWIPGAHWLAWLTGVAFVAIAVGIAIEKRARLVAMLLGAALLLNILLLHVFSLITQLHNPAPWTDTFELLSLCGASFILASVLPLDEPTSLKDNVLSPLATSFAIAGRFVFVISLVIFAIQHFIYARFVATLVPRWIPGHLFWAYFVGVAFIGAALAIAAKVQAKLAALLLGTMFLLWVLVLHLPRVAAAPGNGNEVTSLFIALAMSGASFILAFSLTRDPSV
ncbi:DoxX family protein [Tunturiibacter lichenicola]|uniref:hypothetical protein n=1 Tax=Tunturiibacter lichenicola TaxID=2051959 RepID=UPI0021B1BFC9|nr:hypothetical protein [Edaphobacter lichenicola]